jgi:LPS sulfotransferase NodH
VVFYIHRDPVDVMLSFWRFIHGWEWHEGPKCADPVSFASAAPEGQLMRYQTHQRRNMLDRWAQHVQGWHDAAQGRPRLKLVSYEALKNDYASTVSGFAELLGRQPAVLLPPSPDVNVIKGGNPSVQAQPDIAVLRSLAWKEVGNTMRMLGYGLGNA